MGPDDGSIAHWNSLTLHRVQKQGHLVTFSKSAMPSDDGLS